MNIPTKRRLDKTQVLLQEFKLDNVMAQSIAKGTVPLSRFNNCGRIQRFKGSKACVRVYMRACKLL